MNQRVKKISEIRSTFVVLAIMILIVLALVYAEMFYFTYEFNEMTEDSVYNTTSKIEKEFSEIKESLNGNEVYNSLTKVGEWPIDLESLNPQKLNPFEPKEVITDEVLEIKEDQVAPSTDDTMMVDEEAENLNVETEGSDQTLIQIEEIL